jgi:hypothetical protein
MRAMAARAKEFAGFCGQLAVGWVILDAGDAEAKGLLERSHRFMRTNFEPGRRFCSELDYQAQLDAWTDRANARTHRTTRAVPAARLAEERQRRPTDRAHHEHIAESPCCWVGAAARTAPPQPRVARARLRADDQRRFTHQRQGKAAEAPNRRVTGRLQAVRHG